MNKAIERCFFLIRNNRMTRAWKIRNWQRLKELQDFRGFISL